MTRRPFHKILIKERQIDKSLSKTFSSILLATLQLSVLVNESKLKGELFTMFRKNNNRNQFFSFSPKRSYWQSISPKPPNQDFGQRVNQSN